MWITVSQEVPRTTTNVSIVSVSRRRVSSLCLTSFHSRAFSRIEPPSPVNSTSVGSDTGSPEALLVQAHPHALTEGLVYPSIFDGLITSQ